MGTTQKYAKIRKKKTQDAKLSYGNTNFHQTSNNSVKDLPKKYYLKYKFSQKTNPHHRIGLKTLLPNHIEHHPAQSQKGAESPIPAARVDRAEVGQQSLP